MGNKVRLRHSSPVSEWISMSNGLTDVFINVLALSGSQLAESTSEKRLVVWLSERDQIIGRGTVGFDIDRMPWNKATFYEDKNFLLHVIQAAENQLGWDKLDYTPNVELLLPCLKQFAVLISRLDVKDIQENAAQEWLSRADADNPINCGFPRCKKHDTFLSFLGCQVCNN